MAGLMLLDASGADPHGGPIAGSHVLQLIPAKPGSRAPPRYKSHPLQVASTTNAPVWTT